ncbi:Ribosomal-L28e domain-containing protein [Mycena kentingensis (nom. inval.)]|nr:Ribosomal-L28e domain-containing protein [Mycena kentingensis (nom. inval.)]
MSTDLQWLLLRVCPLHPVQPVADLLRRQNNNCFVVKRGAEVGRIFSKEKGNLRNLHSHKFSGLTNTKTVDVSDSGSGVVVTSRKQKGGPEPRRQGHVQGRAAFDHEHPARGGHRREDYGEEGGQAGFADGECRPSSSFPRLPPALVSRPLRASSPRFPSPRLPTRILLLTQGVGVDTSAISTPPPRAADQTRAGSAPCRYRRPAALARVSALLAAQKERKTYPPKASRSKSTKALAAGGKGKKGKKGADEDEDMPDLV